MVAECRNDTDYQYCTVLYRVFEGQKDTDHHNDIECLNSTQHLYVTECYNDNGKEGRNGTECHNAAGCHNG